MRDALAPEERHRAQATLIAALLGFFVITLDAVVVNVALPTLAHEFGAGVDGLQWMVDGYTLMFGALLLRPVRWSIASARDARSAWDWECSSWLRWSAAGHPTWQ
jgi:hypothetical protein